MPKIDVGRFRADNAGPMQVVSGPMGKEKVHYEVPPAERMESEIPRFLTWLESVKKKIQFLKRRLLTYSL